MAGKSRLQIAKPDIIRHFDELPAKVFKQAEIASQLNQLRGYWRLAQNQSLADFISFLQKSGRLSKVEFPFPKPYKKEIRYIWGQIPLYQILLTLRPRSHFSHYSAVHIHGLTEQVPKTIYLNFEQPSGSISSGTLTQRSIESAFKRQARATSYIADMDDYRVCIVNGKNTGNLGVVEEEVHLDEKIDGKIHFTNIERTLIDIAVRPNYAGGFTEVLKAYRLAQTKASVNRLAALLNRLEYIYPYHQAIGFYLERAGYKSSAIDLLREIPMEFDFYLAHKMGQTDYVKSWRLFIPKGF
jgi:predicted transcriptional regulator of viral defense system